MLAAGCVIALAALPAGFATAKPPPPSAACSLTSATARPLIKEYYDHRGVWAGQYILERVERMRLDRRNPTRYEAHVRYFYRCIRDRCSSLHEGYDQRIFYMQCNAGSWSVVHMGDYMSARLP